jgi:hypothetical protein
VISGGGADCSGTEIGDQFSACNAAGAAGRTSATVGGQTIDCM